MRLQVSRFGAARIHRTGQDRTRLERAVERLKHRIQVDEHIFGQHLHHQQIGTFFIVKLCPRALERSQEDIGAERILGIADLVAFKQEGQTDIKCGELIDMTDFKWPGQAR